MDAKGHGAEGGRGGKREEGGEEEEDDEHRGEENEGRGRKIRRQEELLTGKARMRILLSFFIRALLFIMSGFRVSGGARRRYSSLSLSLSLTHTRARTLYVSLLINLSISLFLRSAVPT